MGTKRTIIILITLAVALLPLHSEIAPEEYRNMQLSAPDAIIIKVIRVTSSGGLFSRTTNVRIQAEVLEVNRSESNLSAGDRITIVYEHYRPPKQGWEGPRSIPILKRGETTFAFIAFDFEEKAYVPAAKGASFEMPIPLR